MVKVLFPPLFLESVGENFTWMREKRRKILSLPPKKI